ncbi:hypothetical protein ACOMHN_014058 [Nucella lapillus]
MFDFTSLSLPPCLYLQVTVNRNGSESETRSRVMRVMEAGRRWRVLRGLPLSVCALRTVITLTATAHSIRLHKLVTFCPELSLPRGQWDYLSQYHGGQWDHTAQYDGVCGTTRTSMMGSVGQLAQYDGVSGTTWPSMMGSVGHLGPVPWGQWDNTAQYDGVSGTTQPSMTGSVGPHSPV